MTRTHIISVFTLFTLLIVIGQQAVTKTVYFCEAVESVLIDKHSAARAKTVGKKFKMEVSAPSSFPGGGVKFSKDAPFFGDFEIHDSWGGVGTKFVVKEKDRGTTVLLFNEAYLVVTSIVDLSSYDGPLWGIKSSADCDKF